MTEKTLNKELVNNYASTIIPLCRLLKFHATNIMLLPNRLILLQPVISGVRNYMIVNPNVDYSRYLYSYMSIAEISKVNTKFRKTKSEIDWGFNNGTNYLIVKNEDEEPCKSPIIHNPDAVRDIINGTYQNLPNWNGDKDHLIDESSSNYTELPSSFIADMLDKKLCELNINGNTALVSKPFLGDLKKTTYVGYKVIDETESSIYVKFKQVEDLGSIYTYAAFLKL